ncbi:MAG: hypothetical protein DI585_03885 [Pseudomonas fluorescens]|nr:MAG: hypothetical protein DI585_03885 [Pseudomonas fluorescens]
MSENLSSLNMTVYWGDRLFEADTPDNLAAKAAAYPMFGADVVPQRLGKHRYELPEAELDAHVESLIGDFCDLQIIVVKGTGVTPVVENAKAPSGLKEHLAALHAEDSYKLDVLVNRPDVLALRALAPSPQGLRRNDG